MSLKVIVFGLTVSLFSMISHYNTRSTYLKLDILEYNNKKKKIQNCLNNCKIYSIYYLNFNFLDLMCVNCIAFLWEKKKK